MRCCLGRFDTINNWSHTVRQRINKSVTLFDILVQNTTQQCTMGNVTFQKFLLGRKLLHQKKKTLVLVLF